MMSTTRKDDSSSSRFYESHGDYVFDAARLEDPSVLLYQKQGSLPQLPVPSLEETIQTFLPTALPLCQSAAEAQSLRAAAQAFPQQAHALHQRLLAKQQQHLSTNKNASWLQLWWNRLGYLQLRDSNALHVSYFFRLRNTTPQNATAAIQDPVPMRRAAEYLASLVTWSDAVQSGTLPVETIGKGPTNICSAQYKYLFHACRIPRPHQDAYRIYNTSKNNNNNNIRCATIVCRGLFYRLPLTTTSIGDSYHSVESLERALRAIEEHSQDQATRRERYPRLGWLTTAHRDAWAEAYPLLEESLADDIEKLSSSVALLCLDVDNDDNDDDTNKRLDDDLAAKRLWHGNGTHSANRWFDKSLQLVVDRQGGLGVIGEHSLADGMPVVRLCQHLLASSSSSSSTASRTDEANNKTTEIPVEPLFQESWSNVPAKMQAAIQSHIDKAQKDLMHRIDAHELRVLQFDSWGADQAKAWGFSPDALVQVAMQLAARNTFGETVATYESSQTRVFFHGRTETTRSVSPASVQFCDCMLNNGGGTTASERRRLLEQATTSHSAYSRRAARGLGVDRHFFGLSIVLEETDRVPDLLQHPCFARSKEWILSTSTLPGTRPGFGPVVPEGLGIGYDVAADNITFTITGQRKSDLVNPMHRALRCALQDIAQLLDETSADARSKPSSKL